MNYSYYFKQPKQAWQHYLSTKASIEEKLLNEFSQDYSAIIINRPWRKS